MSLTHPAQDADIVHSMEALLRVQVQREGVDPQRETAEVRRLAERIVGEHDERSLTGRVLPVGDRHGVVDLLVASLAGFGPLQQYLDDPEVEEIWVNEPSAPSVQVSRSSRLLSPQ